MTRGLSKWTMLAVLFPALLVADQWTKFLAVERLTTVFQDSPAASISQKVGTFYGRTNLEPLATEPYYVFRPWWRMNYVENPGAAWGMFRTLSPGLRFGFFLVVYLAAAAFILRYYRRVREDQRLLQVALALVLAGAIGNFVDRVARRYVIDFVEWYWWNRPDIRWPTFNVADSLIVVGVALLVLHPGTREAAGEEREEAPPAA